MHRDTSVPRTPHSSDKIRIKHHASKSLSKYAIGSGSPVIATKASFKEVKELGVIKERTKKKAEKEKKR